MDVPAAVLAVAVQPKTRTNRERLGIGLAQLRAADPTLRVTTDEQTDETVISGLSELHLEAIRTAWRASSASRRPLRRRC